ncbi:hypothetical protein [Chryseolinea serpens]|nr:hypothetical protein [Chryseolinea serpens]
MKKNVLLLLGMLSLAGSPLFAQTPKTGVGLGIYPTGTETGFGFRSSRDNRWVVDVRATRANVFTKPNSGSFVNEVSLLYRVAYYEKIRFHLGAGGRADWNFAEGQSHRYGFVTPLGIEAFPFPFQHAGLFFEAAPFCTWTNSGTTNVGIRTVAGFVFYFLKKEGKD